MSGSLRNIHSNVSYALHLHSEAMMRLQEQASTGSRINRASDDSTDAYRVLTLGSQSRSLASYMDSISQGTDTLEVSASVIEGMISAVADTKVDMMQIVNGIHDEQGREKLAIAVNDTLEQMVSFANSRRMDEYLFGGAKTGTAPYAVERTNGEITKVIYQGSYEVREIGVAPGVLSSSFCVGEDLFASDERGMPVFIGSTGAKAGSGTSSVRGDVWLTVTHDGSNYRLSIDGGATEVTVPTVGDVSNIAVADSSGRVLYVDATGLSATGKDMVRVPGTYDLFNALMSIRDILRNTQGLEEGQLEELRSSSLSSLEEVRNLLVGKSVMIGSRIGFLETLKGSLGDVKFNLEDEAAILEEADIAQIAIDLSRREVLYQMSLSVAGKLMSMSLLDFVR